MDSSTFGLDLREAATTTTTTATRRQKRDYNGGQKCWDLSSDITKTSDPSPPTPNKVEFGAKWVKLSAFLATTLLGEVGGTMG